MRDGDKDRKAHVVFVYGCFHGKACFAQGAFHRAGEGIGDRGGEIAALRVRVDLRRGQRRLRRSDCSAT